SCQMLSSENKSQVDRPLRRAMVLISSENPGAQLSGYAAAALSSPGGAADPPRAARAQVGLQIVLELANLAFCALFHAPLRVFNRAVGPWVSAAGREAMLARGNPANPKAME